MDIKHEISPEREATITVEVPVEEVGGKFTEALETFRQQAKLPGFRPGKIPKGYVMKRYGKAIMQETADELTRERIEDVLKECDLSPGGQISINLLEYGENKPLRFEVKFPLKPEPVLTKYKKLQVMVNEAEITDTDVDNQIEALRRKNAVLRSIDTPAPAEAKLKLMVQEVDPSGLTLVGKHEEELDFEFGTDQLGFGTDEQLVGISAGEKRMVTIRQVSGVIQAPTQGRIITSDQESWSDKKPGDEIYKSVKAVKVEIPEVPELDDDFARQVNEKLKDVSELKEWTRFNLMAFVGSNALQHLERAVIKSLIEENPFPIPPSIIESTLSEIATQSDFDKEQLSEFIEQNRQEAEHDLRWVLLRDTIAETENIEVDDEEIQNQFVRFAENSEETLEEIKKRYENDDAMDRLKNHLFERKVIDFVMKEADVEKRKMSLDEYLKTSVEKT